MSCQHCQLVFFTPRPHPEELRKFYDTLAYREGYEQSPMVGQTFAQARYHQLNSIIKKFAPHLLTLSSRRMLDIGCGVGDLLKLAAQDGWTVTGTEISAQAAAKANAYLQNQVLVGELSSLKLPENSYDLITIYHVIEHLLDPVDILVKIHRLLKPQGMVLVETPNMGSLGARLRGKRWSQITPPEHITYFNPSSLRYALQQAEFASIAVFTNAPLTIKSISAWSGLAQRMATLTYQIAPWFGLGATLHGVAFKQSL